LMRYGLCRRLKHSRFVDVSESERRKDLRQLKGLVAAHRLAGVGEQRRERL
jgi:hypothetical protein